MKTAFVSVLALASSFMGVLSAPAPATVDSSISRRQDFDALSFVTDLKSTVAPNIESIQSTATSVTPDSTDEEKAAASSSIAEQVAAIIAAVDAADTQIPVAAPTEKKLAKRQATLAAAQILDILTTLSTAADAVTASLGLNAATALFGGLGASLSKLLRDLNTVVDDLLVVVKQLVDALLGGLSKALVGLSF